MVWHRPEALLPRPLDACRDLSIEADAPGRRYGPVGSRRGPQSPGTEVVTEARPYWPHCGAQKSLYPRESLGSASRRNAG
jgi:hypothetical protein